MTDSTQPEPQTPQPDPRYLALVKQEHERLSNVYPTAEDVPGCVSLLDSFLLCNVMKSQFQSLYRYGEMANCGIKKQDFTFCMKNNMQHPEQKRDAWIQRKAEWWAQKRMDSSSEDVWELRTESLANYPPQDLATSPASVIS